jgi:hypothetical protein
MCILVLADVMVPATQVHLVENISHDTSRLPPLVRRGSDGFGAVDAVVDPIPKPSVRHELFR